ncbi:MAG: metal ABC transporter permease [Limisphaerales bacterium]|jgi:manganese/iron transport system permease protein|nr:metal ABC transporter permease [Verrucomicrobiota bacterium]
MDFSLFTSYNSLLLWLPALLCGFLSGTTCGTLGAFVVGMRIPFIGICVAHAALAGAVFAALLGLEGQWLMLPALLTSGVTSLLLGVTNPRWIKMDDNVMMSVLFSATMGLAFLGLGLFAIMGRTDGDVRTLLWGSIAFCRWSDVWIMLTVGGLLAFFVAVFYKELQVILFSREIATSSGIRAGAIWGGFLLLTAMVFTVSLQSVGGLMVYSLVTNPAAAAFQLARGTLRCILLSAFFGMLSGLGGFIISAWTDLPSGAVIVLLSSAIVLLAALWRLGHRN